MKFLTLIENALTEAGSRFGRSLDLLEWPNGEQKNAPPNELNALACLQWALSVKDPTFDFFSEGSIIRRRPVGLRKGRVDLMASNREVSLVIEAKCFGNINRQSDSVFSDLECLRDFKPAYYVGKEKRQIYDWWGNSERWALVLIASFRGDPVKEAWLTSDAREAETLLAQYERREDQPRADGTGFMRLRSVAGMHRFASPIPLGDRWTDTGKGYLLCGAVSRGRGPEDHSNPNETSPDAEFN